MHIIHCHSNTDNTRFLSGLQKALEIIRQVEESAEEQLCIDFSNVKFVTPLFVLPLMVYAHGCHKSLQFINQSYYLNRVSFGLGVKPDDMRIAEFIAYMESYALKSFIPVINFPASKISDDNKSAFLSTVEAIIARQLQLESNVLIGIKYLIGENVDNITEHSDCDRGFGIVTSKKMLIDGLGGHYVMLSGCSMHVKNRNVNNYFEIPNVKWNGTIVALRIPYNNKAFQYTNYLEY